MLSITAMMTLLDDVACDAARLGYPLQVCPDGVVSSLATHA